MKWSNKGHEFDEVFGKLEKLNRFYLFGAGDYGQLFLEMIKNEIQVLGYIDNNKKKQEQIIKGMPVYSLSEIEKSEDIGIIVTASQFARGGIFSELERQGFVENENFFVIETFLSVYFVYKHNKVYFSNISMLPSTRCNLNCECCLNFNPFASKPDIREIERVKKDVDMFFLAVDRVMLFHFSGGEPFLYPYATELVKYLLDNYRENIHVLRMVTNGTIVPKDEILEELSKYQFEIMVDDYREAVPQYDENFSKLIEKLDKYKIKYTINKADSWIDLAPTTTDNSNYSEEELIQHFDTCDQSWQELRDEKLYSCNYDGYATVAGINPIQDEEVYDLRTYTKAKAKELVEFRLGYNGKGYTNLCKHCRGFREENEVKMIPAKQL